MARHNSINAFILCCVTAFAIAGAAACQNTVRGLEQDAKKAEAETRDERAQAADAAREIGSDAAHAANRAGSAATQAGEEIAERAGATFQTLDIKSALMADPSVDATRIDVDTDYRTKTVTLKGYVPTETGKNMAEVIAKAKADGYAVVNSLTVQPRGK